MWAFRFSIGFWKASDIYADDGDVGNKSHGELFGRLVSLIDCFYGMPLIRKGALNKTKLEQ